MGQYEGNMSIHEWKFPITYFHVLASPGHLEDEDEESEGDEKGHPAEGPSYDPDLVLQGYVKRLHGEKRFIQFSLFFYFFRNPTLTGDEK